MLFPAEGGRVRTSNYNYLAGKAKMSPGLPEQGVALGYKQVPSIHKASAQAQKRFSVAHRSNMERPDAFPAQTFKAVFTVQPSLTLKLQSPCLGPPPSARSTGMSTMPGQKASGKPSQAVSLWSCRAYGNEPMGSEGHKCQLWEDVRGRAGMR